MDDNDIMFTKYIEMKLWYYNDETKSVGNCKGNKILSMETQLN